MSKEKQRKLIEHFVAGATARCASILVGINIKSGSYYFQRIREIIAFELEQESQEFFGGEIEVDRINHSKLFVDKKNHINGIENFWNQAKRHMKIFNGVPKQHFGLFLKECQRPFNNPNPKYQLTQILTWLKPYL